MTTREKEMLLREAENLSPELLREVFDFMMFVKARAAHDGLETALLAESVLKRDWLRPEEEEEAWRDL